MAGSNGQKLPVWRLIAGLAVLACLVAAALAIAPVYVADYRFRQYVQALAASPEMSGAPDETVRTKILDRAHQFNLPVQPADVTVKHESGRVQLQVARYKAQVFHADLHFSGVRTK